MASFGSFESEREVYSSASYTVYSAKKAGDPKTEYAIKLFHLSVDADSTEVESLLRDIERSCSERVAVQQKAAAESAFVTPVIETGQDERGVWYATYFYPRSINRIINARVALKRADLEHAIRCIIQGALDLKRVCGRSHGEILPSVVQISKADELTKASIVLSDPLPGDAGDAVPFELADLHAVGRILLQLVLRREMHREEDFLLLPILPSPEWTNLFGKEAAAWLALCNRLLDPKLSLDQLTLEQLKAEIPKPAPSPWPKILAAAAGVIVIGAGAAVFLLRPRQQTVQIITDPPGATILVDNANSEPPLKLKPRDQPYLIIARHTDLHLPDQTNSWRVGPEKVATLNFKFPYGAISINSTPPGADIQDISDTNQAPRSIGKTPHLIPFVPAGTPFKYQLVANQYVTKFVSGTVADGQTNTFSETLALDRDTLPVSLTSSPGGAEIFENGAPISSSVTPTKAKLIEGRHDLTARYLDWPSVTTNLDIKRGVDNVAHFNFPRGFVRIETVSPSQANIFVGSNRVGVTGTTIARPPGTITLRLEADGFKPTNFVVAVVADKTFNFKTEMVSDNGRVEFISDPEDAVILRDQVEIGRTSAGEPFRTNFPPGNYNFTARYEGLADVPFKNVTLNKGSFTTHKFVFAYGTVKFDVFPADATVSAGGKSWAASKTLVQPPLTDVIFRIAAPHYIPTNVSVTVKDHELYRPVPVKLLPEPVPVVLASDPPGVKFFADGQELRTAGNQYSIPWGPVTLVAQHGRLGSITNAATLAFDKPNEISFKFNYGTLVLTNLPTDLELRDGAEIVAPSGQSRPALVYERPGMHTYKYVPAERFKPEEVTTNIVQGQVGFLLRPELKGHVSAVANIPFAWVPWPKGGPWEGKSGPGVWVGIYEVTQEEYEKVMGSNPSTNKGCAKCPVESLKFQEAVNFCQALTSKDPKIKALHWHYALPSEELFDFFAEAKTVSGGSANALADKVVSPSFANRLTVPKPVGGRTANGYQLQDVVGNVSEWIDPGTGAPSVRGANFGTAVAQQQNYQYRDNTKDFSRYYGFRVVLLPGE